MSRGTELVVVTTNAADLAAVGSWIRPQLSGGDLAVVTGYFAVAGAVAAGIPVVVADVGLPDGRTDWRLAELRRHGADLSVVVVADAVHLPMLSGALRADLAVTSVAGLPPLRELLVGVESASDELTS